MLTAFPLSWLILSALFFTCWTSLKVSLPSVERIQRRQDGQNWSQHLASARKPKETMELKFMTFSSRSGNRCMRAFRVPVSGLILPKWTTQHDLNLAVGQT